MCDWWQTHETERWREEIYIQEDKCLTDYYIVRFLFLASMWSNDEDGTLHHLVVGKRMEGAEYFEMLPMLTFHAQGHVQSSRYFFR